MLVSSSFSEPPTVRTLPLGSIVAFISMRGCAIFGPVTHAGEDADRSIISVVLVAGLPPPKMMTLGLYPFAGVRGKRTEEPYVRIPP